ncbi:BglG family transcription antiterminator LicT [Holdemania massiliensis]|uniref:BglG family transcription antiterminator LicT n=1 Tax=Holdemania massiliensis TaxID=1468449 RepID=UPI001F063BC6|nr:PRD domain-containing protein [Holdemania massiliensis]MCH1939842.1 PRD domain-containing protein [Holdemania massiliensis]
MKIHRILTNNAAVVINENGNDQIVCGKGIAYKKKCGEEIDPTLVTQMFVMMPDSKLFSQLEQLLTDIPLDYVILSHEIVKMARVSMGLKLSDSLIISLADHIYGTMRRYREGFSISNGLMWEIQRFYEKEYEIGLLAKEMIEKKFQIELPLDEAAYIAMHIVNAETKDSTLDETMRITKLIQDIIKIIRMFFKVELDESSGYYYRFITHLKYFARRILRNEEVGEQDNSELSKLIFEKYKSAYACSEKIEQFLLDKFDYRISDEEKMYLTIHIHSAVTKSAIQRKEGHSER